MSWWTRVRRWFNPPTIDTQAQFDDLNAAVACRLKVPVRTIRWRVLPASEITRIAKVLGLTTFDTDGLTVGSTILVNAPLQSLIAHEIAHVYGADERTACQIEGAFS